MRNYLLRLSIGNTGDKLPSTPDCGHHLDRPCRMDADGQRWNGGKASPAGLSCAMDGLQDPLACQQISLMPSPSVLVVAAVSTDSASSSPGFRPTEDSKDIVIAVGYLDHNLRSLSITLVTYSTSGEIEKNILAA